MAGLQRPYHPQLIQINNGDLSFLPARFESADGPSYTSFKRVKVGTCDDNGVQREMWFYPCPLTGDKKSTKGLYKPVFVKQPIGGDKHNQLKYKEAFPGLVPKLAFDNRFRGDHQYRPAEPGKKVPKIGILISWESRPSSTSCQLRLGRRISVTSRSRSSISCMRRVTDRRACLLSRRGRSTK